MSQSLSTVEQFHQQTDQLFEKFDLTLSQTMDTKKSKWLMKTGWVGTAVAILAVGQFLQHYTNSLNPKEMLEVLAAEPLYQTIATSAFSFLQIVLPYAIIRRIAEPILYQSEHKLRKSMNFTLDNDEKAELTQMVAMNPHLQKAVVLSLLQDDDKKFGSQDLAKFKAFHQQCEQLQSALFEQLPKDAQDDNKDQAQLRQWFKQQTEKVSHIKIDQIWEQLQGEARSIKNRQQLQADTLKQSAVQRPSHRL